MTTSGILEAHEALYGSNNPHVDSHLIGEPITIDDGTQYALFDCTWKSPGIRQVLALVFDGNPTEHHFWNEDKVLELGNGDFRRGVMEIAKLHMPRRNQTATFVGIDGPIQF